MVSIVLYVLIKVVYLYIRIERGLEVNRWVDISYFGGGAKGGCGMTFILCRVYFHIHLFFESMIIKYLYNGNYKS